MRFPPLATTMVGSWPRPDALLRAQSRKRKGELSRAEFEKLADEAVLDALKRQERAGLDLVTDGEQRRDNFYSFVAEKLSGVRMMTMLELLDHVEDKAGFEKILRTLDVPASSLSNPTCVGRIERREPLAVGELRFTKAHTSKPVKVPLPGPYLLTRAMWVKELARPHYASKEELSRDIVRVLRDEARELAAAGADFIQFDEPVLTEVVFAPKATRTFMCASLAERGDPKEELEFAVRLINEVTAGLKGPLTGVHVCRGNWSRDESTLRRGDYAPLAPDLERLNVDQLVLEYATERAGDVRPFGGKSLGLGVVNPRTDEVESPERIEASVRRALAHYPPDRLFLNPDCGFGTFSRSPMNSADVAERKLAAMVEAARRLRGQAG
ncbi:MAG: cobalamin-independent methionine synthase II family protein [Planctomycetia bacterium]|nr:cobalamin-independent methionine synthase II family protein [Planctomycetia bacterium]